MILILLAILFFWLVLLFARWAASTFIGFVLICGVLGYAFGPWIAVGIAIAVVGLFLAERGTLLPPGTLRR